MFEFLITLLLATAILISLMAVGVAITMPFHGALVRLRANYNPHAVGLDAQSRVGPTLTTLIGTLKRTKQLEGWWGTYPTLAYTTLVSIASIIFVGGSSTKGPKNTYSVPEAGGVRMGLFTIVLTLIALPMTVIINRTSLRVLLSPHELAKPYMLYLTPGLLATTFVHSLCVTLVARTMRVFFLGASAPEDIPDTISPWRWMIFILWQALATGWLTPLEVVSTRLSVQPNTPGAVATEEEEQGPPEGVSFCGTDEDVIGLRPTTEPYLGMIDCGRKVIEEEGWQSLYRGFWWTMLSNVFGAFA
ncbi:uncharacterized protein I303_101021 [Kwoniella dejecticola CBS 10117]|uniref:Mitochondrial carrier n=1 Tax=Kwoniella dejecticola CBS 10117 TaxID=1296121 RepID=A0AAJ8MEN5_9TREE